MADRLSGCRNLCEFRDHRRARRDDGTGHYLIASKGYADRGRMSALGGKPEKLYSV
jgi:hypothetical protein